MITHQRYITIALMWLAATLLLFYKVSAQQLAFPGAEGFAKFTTGGRGGEVVHVTNLNDSGAGSFRDAVSKPNRIVVFDVGGVINISSRIVIHRNIYVAGQTAPGDGITIYGNGVAFNGSSGNNIIRYLRIRMGKNGDSGKDAVAISEGQNYLFDHVSVSWGRDGTFDVNGSGVDNITLQDCIIGQGINNHNHSTGGLMQSGKWSIIRSLYHSNKTRNPKARGTHECINSVFYNWGTNGYIMGDTEGLSECNLMGNYFIFGPSSSSNSHITNTTPSFNVYPSDNWVDSNKDGTLNGTRLTDYKTATVRNSPYNYPGVSNLLSAQEALQHVIEKVGASLTRDAVDLLLIQQLTSYGTLGSIINTEDDNGIPGNVGTVASGTPPTDSDGDGMPDVWETARGLNPTIKDDKGDDDGDGYTNIEEYLSCLVGESNDCDAPSSKDCHGDENGTAILDDCGVCVGGNSAYKACEGSLEAEEACDFEGTIDNNNAGFTGEGFLNTTNTLGAAASWKIHTTTAQTATLTFRYANGGTTSRDGEVYVNGNNVATLVLPTTGAWTTWFTTSINVPLVAGVNELMLQSTTAEGLANLDVLSFSEGVSDAHCLVTGGIKTIRAQLTLYPNPTQDAIYWGEKKEWILMDLQGQILATGLGKRVDLSDLSVGSYFIKIDGYYTRVIKQ